MSGFDTAASCEAAFYAAFEAGDAGAMMAVWAQGSPLLCVHPNGPPLTTRAAVEQSWRRIFQGASAVRFTLSHRQSHEDGALSVRFVHENIHHGPGFRDVAVVLATNVFVREPGGWRMCSHHASPGPLAVEPARDAGAAMH